jgi:hypothetical protein
MVISHRYKFIFLKTEKTASTSLATLFKNIVLDHDKLYPANIESKRTLFRKHGSLDKFSFEEGTGRFRRSLPRYFGLHGHARAKDIHQFVGDEIFKDYKKITSERNPWDRQVSLFAHRSNLNKELSLNDFDRCMRSPVYNALHYNRLHNWDIYAINDEIVADYIIRFEHLKDDLIDVLNAIGIDPDRHTLPHIRSQPRKSSYRDLYSDHSRKLVEHWYAKEIEYFGYSF